MEALVKAAVVGGIGAVAVLTIKKDSAAVGMVLGIACAVFILGLALNMASGILDFTGTIAEMSGISSALFSPLIKTVGIGMLTRIAADVCKDAGQAAAASGIELVGAVSALYVAMPLMKTALEMIGSLL